MDNFKEENFDIAGTLSSLGSLRTNVLTKRRIKEANEMVNKGEYWQMRPYLKSLVPIPTYAQRQIAGHGITKDAVLKYKEQPAGTPIEQIIDDLKIESGGVVGGTAQVFADEPEPEPIPGAASPINSKTIMYVAIAAVVGLVIYFIVKSK